MWKTVLAPIALVIAVWVITSGATTYYLLWLDNSYESALVKNVRSIQAAESLQNDLWRVLLGFPNPARRCRWFSRSLARGTH